MEKKKRERRFYTTEFKKEAFFSWLLLPGGV